MASAMHVELVIFGNLLPFVHFFFFFFDVKLANIFKQAKKRKYNRTNREDKRRHYLIQSEWTISCTTIGRTPIHTCESSLLLTK